VTRDSCPGSSRSTAQSSPIPFKIAVFVGRTLPPALSASLRLLAGLAMRRIWAISAFSGSGTAQLLYRRRNSSAAVSGGFRGGVSPPLLGRSPLQFGVGSCESRSDAGAAPAAAKARFQTAAAKAHQGNRSRRAPVTRSSVTQNAPVRR